MHQDINNKLKILDKEIRKKYIIKYEIGLFTKPFKTGFKILFILLALIYLIRWRGEYDLLTVLYIPWGAFMGAIPVMIIAGMFSSGARRWSMDELDGELEYKNFAKEYIDKLLKNNKITQEEYQEYLQK